MHSIRIKIIGICLIALFNGTGAIPNIYGTEVNGNIVDDIAQRPITCLDCTGHYELNSVEGTIADIDYELSDFYPGPFDAGDYEAVADVWVNNIGGEAGMMYGKVFEYPGTSYENEIYSYGFSCINETFFGCHVSIPNPEEFQSFPWPIGFKTWGEDEPEPQWGVYGKTHQWAVEISGIEPTVEITHPQSGKTYSGKITIEGTADDLDGSIKKVEIQILQLANIAYPAEGTTSWSYEFDTTPLEDAYYTIKAICYDDEGLVGTDYVNFYTKNNYDAPSVRIDSPENGTVVKGSITISGIAEDTDGIESLNKVLVRIDFTDWILLVGRISNNKYSWEYEWNTTKVTEGTHTVYAKSFDGKYYSAEDSVQIIVNNIPDADLVCTANIDWNDTIPDSQIQGELSIKNGGDTGSLLDWKIVAWPEWGTWTFDPIQGQDVTPTDGYRHVQINMTAPSEKHTRFFGDITIVNTNNPGDYEIIEVTLATPKYNVFQNPIIHILRHLFPLTFNS